MRASQGGISRWIAWFNLMVVAVSATALVGCEHASFMDPSKVGRFDRTPVVLPILDRIDAIDEPNSDPAGLSQVRPEDLIAEPKEYTIGSGDLITITIYELLVPGQDSVQTRVVDELGNVRLPVIGKVEASGKTPTQLETAVSDVLRRRGVIKDPTVTVLVQDKRQNTFSVIGEPANSGTAIGTYIIQDSDFRLLEAMALARGVSGTIKRIYVIRQVPLQETSKPAASGTKGGEENGDGGAGSAESIEDLLRQFDESSTDPKRETGEQGGDAPEALERALDDPGDQPWVNIDGKWVRSPNRVPSRQGEGNQGPVLTQRIIEIHYDKLLDGDMSYNVVIRPGDIIRVPPPVIGNIYVGGEISRPGTYSLPGDRDLTLKQLIFSAGGFSPTAVPERVDLIRRVGDSQEAIVRLNVRAIFEGTQPDIFLKPNDTINVGTNFWATPLAVVRNGFRASYGFGFVLDRNFGPGVFD